MIYRGDPETMSTPDPAYPAACFPKRSAVFCSIADSTDAALRSYAFFCSCPLSYCPKPERADPPALTPAERAIAVPVEIPDICLHQSGLNESLITRPRSVKGNG